jgi:hypothetical protein
MAKARRKKHTIESLSQEQNPWLIRLQGESDRGAALIAGAYLEVTLSSMLRRFLIDEAKTVDELFGDNRPLGSFSSCIKMAYCLGLIGPKMRTNLDIIRGIRNDFAHSHDELMFSHPGIQERCLSLGTFFPKSFWGTSQPRNVFLVMVALMSQRLMVDALGLERRKPAVDPGIIGNAGRED